MNCGCEIRTRSKKSVALGMLRTYIIFCPLHAAAPQMLEALEHVEWTPADQIRLYEDEDDRFSCPWCKQMSVEGHADDCKREANIAAARGES